jgi:UDP-N-acetylglucosamine 2-epimerase (non-hydrolysing)
MVPVMIRLRDRDIPYRFIHTGQHRATMSEMLDEFGLRKPDVILYNGPDIVAIPQMARWMVRILRR